MTDQDKVRIALLGLADLLTRDAVEIATDPRYTRPETAPLPIVGELNQHAKQLKRMAKRK